MEYEDSILLICSFHPRASSSDETDYMFDYVMDALQAIGLKFNDYIIGLSEPKSSLGYMGRAVLESRYAVDYADLKKMYYSVDLKNLAFIKFLYQMLIIHGFTPIMNL